METCVSATGACLPGEAPGCDDGIPCTQDSCNIGADLCANVLVDAACDDGSDCTTDTCSATGCVYAALPQGSACGDPVVAECLSPWACDGEGACVSGNVEDGTPCSDDGNECTSDVCTAGLCEHLAKSSGDACGDSADGPCTAPDTCDGAGTCLANDEPDETACPGDALICTDDICLAGACEHPALPIGTLCDGAGAEDCSGADTCDGEGACVANDGSDGSPCTPDDNDCTQDQCEAGVCTHPVSELGAPCGDSEGSDCSAPDSCDAGGICLLNHAPDGDACADDGNECSEDVCDSGACVHPASAPGASCGDPLEDDCTAADSCDGAGACLANDAPDDASCTTDDNDCTDDVCVAGACEHPPSVIGTSCGDGSVSACDGADSCDGEGACLVNFSADDTACESDDSECTDDLCSGGLCTHVPLSEGVACGDPSATDCSAPGSCDAAGLCLGNDFEDGTPCTDDGNDCTEDVCASGACTHEPAALGTVCGGEVADCKLPGTCDGDGFCSGNNKDDGVACGDDGNDCTDDVCAGGLCSHPAKDSGATCGDPLEDDCTAADSCDGAGACLANDAPDDGPCATDGNDCTDDVCVAGACAHPPSVLGTSCGDGSVSACDGADSCDGEGACLVNFSADDTACESDDKDCTDDLCAGGLCTHVPLAQGAACGDQSATDCTAPGSCDAAGLCLSNDAEDGAPCMDDGDGCTEDACASGVCTHEPSAIGTVCGDKVADCTAPGTCDADGVCTGSNEDDGTPCADDENECTDDVCGSGICTHPAKDSGVTCGDPQVTDCSAADSCDGAGACVANDEVDGTPCTPDSNDCTADSCDAGVCAHPFLPEGAACGETTGSACSAADSCDAAGTCLPRHLADDTPCPDDADPCTADLCQAGACAHPLMPVGSPCDDEVFCNGNETCDDQGACQPGTEPGCDDEIPCTADACDLIADACEHVSDDGLCDNGLLCDGVEICDPVAGCVVDEDQPPCDDGIPCTIDLCDPLTELCSAEPDNAFCDDGDPCTGQEGCDAVLGCRVERPQLDGNCAVTCGPDLFEPNDDFGTATPMGAGITDWLTVCSEELDYFELTLGNNELIEVSLQFEDAVGNVDLRLYNADHQLVASSTTSTDDEYLVYATAAAGIYYLRVNLGVGGDDQINGNYYTLETQIGESCTDVFEDNDSSADAAELGALTVRDLTACPYDEDFYAVELAEDELVIIEAAFDDASGDIDLSLMNPAGANVASATTNTDNERIVYNAAAAGTYSLRVALDPFDNDDDAPGNTYDLTVLVGDTCTDSYEPNDTIEDAIPLGSDGYFGMRACPDDTDLYEIVVGNNEIIEIQAFFVHTIGDVDLRLYDPVGAQVASATSNSDDERLVYTSMSAGIYHISVALDPYAADDAFPGNFYDLQVTLGAPCTDVYEDNDSSSRATVLGAGTFTGLQACPNDEDYYDLPMTEGETLTVTAVFDHAQGDIDLVLRSPTGGQVASSASNSSDESLSYTAPATGIYQLRVALDVYAADDAVPGNGYTLDLTGIADCVPTTTCDDHGAQCGLLHDGCGEMLDCGSCPAGEPCSASLICACAPTTCEAEGATCGGVFDGCDLMLACGDCVDPAICGGAYVDNECAAPTCADDVYEDDDSLAEATPVSAGVYAGMIICDGDDDYYAFDAAANEVIRVGAVFSHATGDVDLRLYNPDGGQVAVSASNSDDEFLVYTVLSAGTHSLRVSLDPYAGDDTLPGNSYELEFGLGEFCTDEHEDNDTLDSAVALGAGAYPGLNSCPNDADYYRFNLGANEIIQVDALFSHGLGDIDLRLYDPTGALVASSASNSDDERIVYTTLASGTYAVYVGLDPYAADDATPGNFYELVLTLGAPCTDVFEDNDSQARAYPLGSGDFLGLRSCPNDGDYYSMNLSEGETLIVDATFAHAAGDIDLRVYGPSGAQVASATSNSDDEHIEYLVANTGEHIVSVALDVYAADDETPGNAYSLTISGPAPCAPTTSCVDYGAECGELHDGCGLLLSCGSCSAGVLCSDNHLCGCVATTCEAAGANCGLMSDGCGISLSCGECVEPEHCGGAYVDNVCALLSCIDDIYEDDDTAETATPIDPGYYTGMTICADDPDYYSFYVDTNELIVVSAVFAHAEGDVDIRLHGPYANQVASSGSNSDDERLVYTTLDAGTYALRVQLDPYGGDDLLPGNRYELDVAYGAPCTDMHEDNETLETAVPLDDGTHSGLKACPNDADWYELLLSNNELVLIDTLFAHAEGDVDVNLYNSRGVQVAASGSNSDNEYITYTTSEAGYFYLRVRLDPYGGDDAAPGADYALEIQLGTGCTDVYEDNDVVEDAVTLVHGVFADLVSCPADGDWYEFSVANNEVIDVSAQFSDATGDIDLILYDATVTQVATATSNSDDEAIVYTAPQAGVFHLLARLDPYDDSGFRGGNPYAIDLSLGTFCTDAFEDNDAMDSPAAITPGSHTGLTACPFDGDYYVLELNGGETLEATATFLHEAGDVDMRLYGPSGALIVGSTSNSDNEAVSHIAEVTGSHTLYIALDPYAADDETPGNSYELEIVVTP